MDVTCTITLLFCINRCLCLWKFSIIQRKEEYEKSEMETSFCCQDLWEKNDWCVINNFFIFV